MKLTEFLTLTNSKQENIITWDTDTSLVNVKQNGFLLQYVKEQTPEICMEAVKQNGGSLQYVDVRIFDGE